MKTQKKFILGKTVETYNPVTLIKKITGNSLIGLGIITLPLPTGSIWAIMGGCMLLSIDYSKLLRTFKFYSKEAYYWLRRVL